MRVALDRQTHTEVHHFRFVAVAGVAFLALVLQAFLRKFTVRADYLELPLLVTVYFSLSRRNPATGLLLGMTIGLVQDGLSHQPIGLYGLAKTCVGYLASVIGARIEVEAPVIRFLFMLLFFLVHQVILALTERVLLAQHPQFFTRGLLIAALVNSALAVIFFPLLDRLRRND